MEMDVCPFCEQGRIFKVRLNPLSIEYSGSRIFHWCEECDTFMQGDEADACWRLAEKLGIPEALLWKDMEILQIREMQDGQEVIFPDFLRGDNPYTDFYAEGSLWGQALRNHISVSFAKLPDRNKKQFPNALPDVYSTLMKALHTINCKLAFIEANEAAIKQSAAFLHELAEDWLYELVENEDDTEVTLEDGSTIPVDVSPQRFMESLFPVALSFEFKESTAVCSAYLELLCEPDWFAGHRIHIKINEQNEIECEGI